jgi:hypothetical protein
MHESFSLSFPLMFGGLMKRMKSQQVAEGTHLRTGLEAASGVAMPMALIRCCMVGVAELDERLPVPMRGTDDCCIC